MLCSLLAVTGLTLNRLEAPPVINTPVYSLATRGTDGATNMQILTYATPVGVSPRLWAISLYRPTQTHANWLEQGAGVLQCLCSSHTGLVHTLGGQSGADVDKAAACAAAGFEWMEPLPHSAWVDEAAASSSVDADDVQSDNEDATHVQLLPGCVAYLRLVQVGELTSCGEHALAVCRVEGVLGAPDGGATTDDALQTRALREAGIISDKGKAIPPTTE